MRQVVTRERAREPSEERRLGYLKIQFYFMKIPFKIPSALNKKEIFVTSLDLLNNWLNQSHASYELLPLSGDASFRRYFRLKTPDQSYIVMDAPPEKENAHYFSTLARAIESQGVRVPHVFAEDQENGFLLLSDFGDTQLLNVLDDDSVDGWYRNAIKTLVQWQSVDVSTQIALPDFNEKLYRYEFNLLFEWFLPKYCQVEISNNEKLQLESCFQLLMQSALNQPRVFVHRDYHSRNLMVCDDGELGFLDFQDAVIGPITYDLVSLLKDCYVVWDVEKVNAWARFYFDIYADTHLQGVSFDTFLRWFDWMGLQRHLKCLGIFSRLAFRDGKKGYLEDIPRVFDYVIGVCEKYNDFSSLKEILSRAYNSSPLAGAHVL